MHTFTKIYFKFIKTLMFVIEKKNYFSLETPTSKFSVEGYSKFSNFFMKVFGGPRVIRT